MKYFFLIPFLAFLLFSLSNKTETTDRVALLKEIYNRKQNALSCFPQRNRSMVASGIGILPGSGKHHWDIRAADSAQLYFDQGMNMYYSFHIIEALASFIKGQQFAPENAMLHWAEALAYGPNINDIGYSLSPDALKALDNAKKYSASMNETEKGLVAAMEARYSADTTISRLQLNEAYRDAMAKLSAQHPNDAELAALYADALIIMHPWDLYNVDGSPKPWTGEIVSVLEKGLKVNKDHPGLNHYYIHSVEGSTLPGRALPSANMLAETVPGAAHMVHMPSHIYIRTGDYGKGITVNQKALTVYDTYLALYPDVAKSQFLYQLHNGHMMAANAIMNGNASMAKRSAALCRNLTTEDMHSQPAPTGEMLQYIYATPVFAMIRYGHWDELLNLPAAADSSIYLRILFSFGKGVALARTGKLQLADKELTNMTNLMESHPKLKIVAFNTAYDASNVAKHMLIGIIAEERKEYDDAARYLAEAARLEENMVYNEPKDWILPPLPYLGQVLLKQQKWADAEKAFRKDLAFNPNNCWSLKGLELAQMERGASKEAAQTSALLKKALKGSDIVLQNAVF